MRALQSSLSASVGVPPPLGLLAAVAEPAGAHNAPAGSITLEDSIWAKPFLDAHDIDGDGRVTLVRGRAASRCPWRAPAHLTPQAFLCRWQKPTPRAARFGATDTQPRCLRVPTERVLIRLLQKAAR